VRVRLALTNTGLVTGKEVVQVYVGDLDSSLDRPVRELKAFTKIELTPGQSAPVSFELHARDLSYYSPDHGRWVLEAGDFEIAVGASSRDLRLRTTVTVDAPALLKPLTPHSPIRDWLAHPTGGPLLLQAMSTGQDPSVVTDPTIFRMIESLPLSRLVAMSGGLLDIDRLLEESSAHSR
jgi:beta-glucosidase